jgi:hypothetical protein
LRTPGINRHCLRMCINKRLEIHAECDSLQLPKEAVYDDFCKLDHVKISRQY